MILKAMRQVPKGESVNREKQSGLNYSSIMKLRLEKEST